MIIHPRFYEPQHISREEGRKQLGLDPCLPTALIMFGGHGSDVMLDIAERLEELPVPVQAIYICGKNSLLVRDLKSGVWRHPRHVVGFTFEVPFYMHLCDFFVGKPGPGSISEALQMQLPVLVECNHRTMPQERYNAQWIAERGVGVSFRNPLRLKRAIEQMLQDGLYREFKANVIALRNRAVFEVPLILRDILDRVNVRREATA